MKKTFAKFALLLPVVFALLLSACASSYETGVKANVTGNTQYQNTQNEQLNVIQMCYIYSKDTSQCSILAAGAIPTQVLGGRPTPIRVAQAPEEILKEIATNGFEAAVKVYGLKQIASVVNNSTAEAGKVEIVKPEIVRPEIVMPMIVRP